MSKTTLSKTTLGMALGLLLSAATAGAQDPARANAAAAGNTAASFFLEQFDSDGDGAVSAEQFVAFRKQRYADTDENKDGSVDVDEYTSEYLVRLDRRLATERQAQVEQTRVRIKALDTDQDGYISRAEYDASGARAFAHFESGAGQPEARPAPRRSAIDMPSTHTRAGMLEIYDADGDGKVARAEYDDGRDQAFARTDGDQDGRLSGDEYLAEFEDRLDRRIASSREAAAQQSRVRFKALDTGKDERVGWDEYAASGKRMFARADSNGDGTVNAEDPPPQQPDAHDGIRIPAAVTTPAPGTTR